MRWLGILAVLGYRLFLRPFLRRRCLYDESCSTHAIRLLRTHGLVSALPLIRARIHSCRMPMSACFVIDADGRARLLSATGADGAAPPPRALELIAAEAEQQANATRTLRRA
jgi:putative component of membrane protein insertase Oxa1/YidC/SpoIIIJ protein YidD